MSDFVVGPFLRELRLEKGMEAEVAASIIGVSEKELTKWEEGTLLPTINYIQPLAEMYEVSVNELVAGSRLSEEEAIPTQEEQASQILDYASSNMTENFKQRRKEWLIAITAVLAFAIIACIVIDLLSVGRITWSGISGVSIVFAWGIILPLFFRMGSAVMSSLIAFSILIIPYLFVLDLVIGADSILTNVAVPITIVSLIYLWALYFVYTRMKLTIWRFLAVAALGAVPVSIIINYVVSMQFNVPFLTVWNILTVVILLAIGIGLIYWERRKNQPPTSPGE